MAKWPKDNQAALIAFYGKPGLAVSSQLVSVKLPFQMTYDGKPTTLKFHKKAVAALERALGKVWDYYGHNLQTIQALGITKTAGTYNHRMIRGSATKWSNHAFGAAIDINAEQNGFHMTGNIPRVMVAAFKSEGASWGGDYKTRPDPMHFEFCDRGEPVRTFEEWLKHYGVTAPVVVSTPAVVTASAVSTSDRRTRMGRAILGYEAQRDPNGNVKVYAPPANDGGGAFEYAGINIKYHPEQATLLRSLYQAGKHKEAEAAAVEYILKYSDPAAGWSTNAGIEFYGRDCYFNRGPGGAAEILQMALGVDVDGNVGPETRQALSNIGPSELLNKLRAAREAWEDKRDREKGARPNLRPGLVNRWNKALVDARKFALETPTATQGRVATAVMTAGAGGAGGTAVTAAQQGWLWWQWSLLGLAVVGGLVVAYLVYRWWVNRVPKSDPVKVEVAATIAAAEPKMDIDKMFAEVEMEVAPHPSPTPVVKKRKKIAKKESK